MAKRSMVILAVVWMIIVVASVSSAVTLAVSGISPQSGAAEGTATTVSAEEYALIDRYGRLDEVRSIMKSEYYIEVDDDALVDGAIRGMLGSVDDAYTFYYTPEEMAEMNEHTEGVYQGIGILLSGDKNGLLTVLRVFRDSPAQKAGIVAGDRIIAIAGQTVTAETNKEVNDAIELVKKAENHVMLTILRGTEEKDVEVALDSIQVNRVDYEMLDEQIGYLAIYEFMGDDVSGFKAAINDFQMRGAKGMIIDLRSNPGGLLTHVVEIADMLLPDGLIVYIEDRYGKRDEYFSDASRYDIPMVVLVDGMSASASEILAASLKEYGLARIVGENTYGKGIVQTVIPFRSDGAGMQLTTARYFTPKGNSIHEVGVAPDVYVPIGEEYDASIVHVDLENDNQLSAAYREIREMVGE